ncbi:hypothetical protein HBH56_151540 [Parastagonospora nodorum]|nr:hypothetical protein HBH56_151540 [Parastagonospora nodorum]KAH3928560.1 hypothetical protein HBH54_137470 [Parastagonospora nodorum]KAH4142249.1 hypothetical protein HBH45_052760 [Parastagonospora nodorum]KAH4155981.1 hypothetical protein HBH44_129490 [Parastagonospora nodorum]KAH4576098.1 hypothetical protein HBH84_074110 [Parastagonospora nodorum]
MLLTSIVEVIIFVSLEQCSTVPHRSPLPPARVLVASKYLFALLLAANVLLPRELDCCNYYVEEASKPTLRAAD